MTITTDTLYQRLGLTEKQLSAFCERWQIAKLDLFGSILTDEFGIGSDIDMLVTYRPDARRGLIEKIDMKEELEKLTSRNIDLVSKKAIEKSRNWVRRRNILEAAKVIYVA